MFRPLLLGIILALLLGCAEGQKPNPLPRAREDEQKLPRALPAKPQN
jgi:hypothetical protein